MICIVIFVHLFNHSLNLNCRYLASDAHGYPIMHNSPPLFYVLAKLNLITFNTTFSHMIQRPSLRRQENIYNFLPVQLLYCTSTGM